MPAEREWARDQGKWSAQWKAEFERADLYERTLRELWSDGSVRAAIGEASPSRLYERIEQLLSEPCPNPPQDPTTKKPEDADAKGPGSSQT